MEREPLSIPCPFPGPPPGLVTACFCSRAWGAATVQVSVCERSQPRRRFQTGGGGMLECRLSVWEPPLANLTHA